MPKIIKKKKIFYFDILRALGQCHDFRLNKSLWKLLNEKNCFLGILV